MKTIVLVVGIVIAMVLIAGCSNAPELPKFPVYKKVCSTDSGNITAKAAIPDPTGWGGTRYTITLDYNSTYQTTADNFAKAKIGGFVTNEMCWNQDVNQ